MGLLSPFKLVKLRIQGFAESARGAGSALSPSTGFEAMYNPTSVTRSFAVDWAKIKALGDNAKPEYTGQQPSSLSLTLTLDGTGVEDMGILRIGQKSVAERLEDFHKITTRVQGETHEPAYLRIDWGEAIPSFDCRLTSYDLKYSLFDRDGKVLRVEINAKFISDESAETQAAEKAKTSSPDLTHSRIVRAGDTLPLLTRQIYGSDARYLELARFNDLDDFRNLTPGQVLEFPPMAVLLRGGRRGA